jgi:hypothetical protein
MPPVIKTTSDFTLINLKLNSFNEIAKQQCLFQCHALKKI